MDIHRLCWPAVSIWCCVPAFLRAAQLPGSPKPHDYDCHGSNTHPHRCRWCDVIGEWQCAGYVVVVSAVQRPTSNRCASADVGFSKSMFDPHRLIRLPAMDRDCWRLIRILSICVVYLWMTDMCPTAPRPASGWLDQSTFSMRTHACAAKWYTVVGTRQRNDSSPRNSEVPERCVAASGLWRR